MYCCIEFPPGTEIGADLDNRVLTVRRGTSSIRSEPSIWFSEDDMVLYPLSVLETELSLLPSLSHFLSTPCVSDPFFPESLRTVPLRALQVHLCMDRPSLFWIPGDSPYEMTV